MALIMYCVRPSGLILLLVLAICTFSDCYDPLDPSGNITVTFDIHDWTNDGYVTRVTIQNFYLYRHVEKPGWKIGWTWTKNEVILSMSGAFATVQGNCSNFKYRKPHSCEQSPVIEDLMPDASAATMSENCCRGGLLSAWAIDPSKSLSSFEMTVGNLGENSTVHPLANLTILAPGPGYTCGPVRDTDPTVISDIGGRRQVQVFRTWKSTCTYSKFLADIAPLCCVSLSTFYNRKVTTCPKCSCGCKETDETTVPCIREGDTSSLSDMNSLDMVQCTDHMCPIGVHWHIQTNYMNQWRVKLTISNYNYNRNYTDWNVLVQHPGFSQKTIAYSFNSTNLPSDGFADDVAIFWGLQYFNDELIHASDIQPGSVTTEILLQKDSDSFTLRNGWALPRRIYFSGEECAMPLPDTFPMLPNGSFSEKPPHLLILFVLISLSYKILFLGLDK